MAMATGKAVVATPFEHAKFALMGGRGVLIPFRDHASLASEVSSLLGDSARVLRIGEAAKDYVKDKSWKRVGQRYLEVFNELRFSPRDECSKTVIEA